MADLKKLYKVMQYLDETNTKTLKDPFVRGLTDGTDGLVYISDTEFVSNYSNQTGLDQTDIEKLLTVAEALKFIKRHKIDTIVTIEVLKRGFDFLDKAWWGKKGYWREVVSQDDKLINLWLPLVTGVLGGVIGALIIHMLIPAQK